MRGALGAFKTLDVAETLGASYAYYVSGVSYMPNALGALGALGARDVMDTANAGGVREDVDACNV